MSDPTTVPKVCPRCEVQVDSRERLCPTCNVILVESDDLARIGTTVGNYHLGKILGRGGMGTVYKGEHVYIGRPVAVKVLHPRFASFEDAVKRFLREARAASSINHPNIVDVTDFGAMPDGGVFFTMEYLEGTSIEDLIEKDGCIPLHRALNVTNQMALALAAAHDVGIVHRDLKPDNIMLIRKPGRRTLVRALTGDNASTNPNDFVLEKEDEYDFVKIFDFGIAKVSTPDDLSPRRTAQGAVFGTPEYMSPEAAQGKEIDHRADIYSIGVILFDMIAGRPPFEAEDAADVLSMHINSPPPSPLDVSPHAEVTATTIALIHKALAKNPDERHQSLDEFREELQGCYGNIAFKRNSNAFGDPPRKPRTRDLTDEIGEWIEQEQGLSLEEARKVAVTQETRRQMRLSEQDTGRITTAVDKALDDSDD